MNELNPQNFNEAQCWGVKLMLALNSEDPVESLSGFLDPEKTVIYVPEWAKKLISSYLKGGQQ